MPQQAKGQFQSKPSIVERRKNMKYKVDTTSTTASGVVPIKGATRYPDEPEIYFTREAWVKQCHLVRQCSKEVGWFALVDHDPDECTFTITELVIPKQEVTAAETDIGKEDLADAAMELLEQGKDTSKMYAWFHSHVNMGVSPSGQDEYQVEDFLEDLADQPEVPAFIRGIQNKKGDLKIDVYYVQHGVAYQNVDFYVLHDDDPQWTKDIDAEIKAKVTERTYNSWKGGSGGNRQQTGKSGNANNVTHASSGWSWADGYYRRDYTNWQDWDEDDWDTLYGIRESEAAASGPTLDTGDSPDLPEPVMFNQREYFDMEIVHSTVDKVEVMMDGQGKLYVCDTNGKMYHYDEWVAAYGEPDDAYDLDDYVTFN